MANEVRRCQDARLHALALVTVHGLSFDGEFVALELHSAIRLRRHTVAVLHAHRFGLETCDRHHLSAHVHIQKPHKEMWRQCAHDRALHPLTNVGQHCKCCHASSTVRREVL
jgi:hypothetical protein